MNSIFLFGPSGEIILDKHFAAAVPRSVADAFWDQVLKYPERSEVPPVISTSRWYYYHIQRDEVFYLAVVRSETPALFVIEFLERIYVILKEYCGKEVSEERIKDKLVQVFQVIDEMMDAGHPFTTEPNIMKEIIPTSSLVKDWIDRVPLPDTLFSDIGGKLGFTPRKDDVRSRIPGPSRTMPTNIYWRAPGKKYTNNEIYFDITEQLDCILDAGGRVIRADVFGEVMCNCCLSGMPDLTLAWTNARILDDLNFHPCVRYNRWDQSKVISFVPPDGIFKLMTYRTAKGSLEVPIYIRPQITFSDSGGRVDVSVGQKGMASKTPDNVKIIIPFHKTTASTNLTANLGTVRYDEITKVLTWDIGSLPKDKTPSLTGNVVLSTGAQRPARNPVIRASFKVSQFAASGLKVDSLAVHGEEYKPYKGVKAITKAGRFEIRT